MHTSKILNFPDKKKRKLEEINILLKFYHNYDKYVYNN